MIDLLKALTALAFISSLFGEHLAFSSGKSVSSACQEAEAVFRDPEIQWMAVLCILVYLVIFAAMREQRLRRRITPKGGIDHWRVAFLVISTLVYFLNYQRASQSTQTAILLSGALIGSGVGVSLFWREEPGSNKQSLWRFVALMVIMLAIACLWKSGYGSSFSYKKNARWVGPWDNPNLYGLLMASGAALALGLAFSSAGMVDASGSRRRYWNHLKSAMFLAAAGIMCFGLWKSYSRGAWVAADVGGWYLLIQWCKRTTHHWPLFTRHYFVAFAVCLLLVVLFWQYQHTESVTAHRALSASNQNDFSWRNRVAAWEGTLQMMAERPWLGWGWNQPDPFYRHYYFTSRIDETGAVQLNDYLMLGATLGIPALFCFCMYLWLALTQKLEIGNRKSEMAQLAWLKTVCRARALVLAVGFWFDGGLFKLPTAATFWILLELGREN